MIIYFIHSNSSSSLFTASHTTVTTKPTFVFEIILILVLLTNLIPLKLTPSRDDVQSPQQQLSKTACHQEPITGYHHHLSYTKHHKESQTFTSPFLFPFEHGGSDDKTVSPHWLLSCNSSPEGAAQTQHNKSGNLVSRSPEILSYVSKADANPPYLSLRHFTHHILLFTHQSLIYRDRNKLTVGTPELNV